MADIGSAKAFLFREMPAPVPGDLRIRWRVCLLLLLIDASRAKRASLAKLYALSSLVQSAQARAIFDVIRSKEYSYSNWQMRVEPALARALDLMAGDNLVNWTTVSDRIGVVLTTEGKTAVAAVKNCEGVLIDEKKALASIGPAVTEAFVSHVISIRSIKG